MGGTRRRRGLRNVPIATVATLFVALFSIPILSMTASGLGLEAVVALHWLVAAVVVGVVLGVERESLASIGVRRPAWIDLGYLVGTVVVAMAIFVFAGPVLEAVGVSAAAGTSGVDADAGFGVALAWAITVGIVEELLYRGYAIERLADYTGRPLVAGALTWVAFTAAHLVAWPIGNVIQTSAVTAVFVAVYLRRRTLVPVVGAHALIWVLAVFEQFFA